MKPVMQAVEITTPGAPQVLAPVQRPIPLPTHKDNIRIKKFK